MPGTSEAVEESQSLWDNCRAKVHVFWSAQVGFGI